MFLRCAGIEDGPTGAPVVPALHAPSRFLDAVDPDGEGRFFGEKLNFANDAASAAPSTGAAGIAMDTVSPQPRGIGLLHHFRRIVFLSNIIDGVDTVRVWPSTVSDADAVAHQEGRAVVADAAREINHIGAVGRGGLTASGVDQSHG